jgi:pimeloyl-ACP methyl ester carboxylesterase
MSVEERVFALRPGLRMAARVHHAGAPQRVLAVHGWLDNAASFDALAACLPQCEIVAVDLPGHGRSDHRPRGAWYHHVDYLDELLAVLDALGWQRSAWLGHSLGGGLLSMLAAAMPERVDRLVLVESAGLLGGDAASATGRLRQGLQDRATASDKTLRVFADLDTAIQARRAAGGLTEPAARQLVERGTRAVDGGWVWSSDPRLRLATPMRSDESHIRALLAAIACPTLVLLADPPPPFLPREAAAARLQCLRDAQVHSLPGSHHLHMETPQPLARLVSLFLAGTSAS